MSRLNLNSTVQRHPDVIAAEAGDDVVMVSIEKGHYYGVSDVGREIWGSIEHPVRVSNLIDHLVLTFNVDRPLCEQETLAFLEDLLSENLLQVQNELRS
jgi:hypothetical protein